MMIPGAVVLLAVSLVETQIFPADDDSRFPVPSAVSLVETQIFLRMMIPGAVVLSFSFQFSVWSASSTVLGRRPIVCTVLVPAHPHELQSHSTEI